MKVHVGVANMRRPSDHRGRRENLTRRMSRGCSRPIDPPWSRKEWGPSLAPRRSFDRYQLLNSALAFSYADCNSSKASMKPCFV